MKLPARQAGDSGDILRHWQLAVAILLGIAAASMYQADLVPPDHDEWLTVSSAVLGDLGDPADFMDWHLRSHPSHMPGYYILLAVWSRLISPELAVLRMLGLFLALLHAALAYRLAKVFIAPAAGFFALVFLASNAFINFYIAHARPYMLFTTLASLTVWHYLRLVHGQRQGKASARELLALGGSVFALVMTHLFSATLLFTLGMYHLLFARKDRRWLAVALTVVTAVLVCLPMAAYMLSRVDASISHIPGSLTGGFTVANRWLEAMTNNSQLPLLALVAMGLALGIRGGGISRLKPIVALPALFLVSLALVGEFTRFAAPSTMRYHLDGWILVALVASASMCLLYRWKRWLGLLALFWVLFGLAFQQHANWWQFVTIRASSFWMPPTQAISRLAREDGGTPALLAFPYGVLYRGTLRRPELSGLEERAHMIDYYFSRHGLEIGAPGTLEGFSELLERQVLHAPSVWHFHQLEADAAKVVAAADLLLRHNYRLCAETAVGIETVIKQYQWRLLDCQPPAISVSSQTALIKYELYELGLNADGSAALFIDKWLPRSEFEQQQYKMSWQIIGADWQGFAQLDLPLVHQGELRQFSLDITRAPAGDYQLMLIIYDAATGERLPWADNPGYVPEMLPLGEIVIPEN